MLLFDCMTFDGFYVAALLQVKAASRVPFLAPAKSAWKEARRACLWLRSKITSARLRWQGRFQSCKSLVCAQKMTEKLCRAMARMLSSQLPVAEMRTVILSSSLHSTQPNFFVTATQQPRTPLNFVSFNCQQKGSHDPCVPILTADQHCY